MTEDEFSPLEDASDPSVNSDAPPIQVENSDNVDNSVDPDSDPEEDVSYEENPEGKELYRGHSADIKGEEPV